MMKSGNPFAVLRPQQRRPSDAQLPLPVSPKSPRPGSVSPGKTWREAAMTGGPQDKVIKSPQSRCTSPEKGVAPEVTRSALPSDKAGGRWIAASPLRQRILSHANSPTKSKASPLKPSDPTTLTTTAQMRSTSPPMPSTVSSVPGAPIMKSATCSPEVPVASPVMQSLAAAVMSVASATMKLTTSPIMSTASPGMSATSSIRSMTNSRAASPTSTTTTTTKFMSYEKERSPSPHSLSNPSPRMMRSPSRGRGDDRSPSPDQSPSRYRRGSVEPRGRSPARRRFSKSPERRESRMSVTFATTVARQVDAAEASTTDTVCEMENGTNGDMEAVLARRWGYTLGAELAHHVVGVFADGRNVSSNRRWDQQGFGSNPWAYLASHQFFQAPFRVPEVANNLPPSMRCIPDAVNLASIIVNRRNDLQHSQFPEDLYLRIKQFKEDRLMKHLLPQHKDLYDFLSCDKFLANWFIGTPRIYRLTTQLLYNIRCALNLPEDVEWSTTYESNELAKCFIDKVYCIIASDNNKEWFKNGWPKSTLELTKEIDRIERNDDSFGPCVDKSWRKLDDIQCAYKKCLESGLLTPAVKKFCSLPCAFLESIEQIGLIEIDDVEANVNTHNC